MGVCVALGYAVNFKHCCQRLLQPIPLSEKGAIPSDLIAQKGLQLHALVGLLCQSSLELVDVAIRAHAAALTVNFVLSVHAFVTA